MSDAAPPAPPPDGEAAEDDVVFEADGSMTIRGRTLASVERLAARVGLTPEAALREALSASPDRARADAAGRTGG